MTNTTRTALAAMSGDLPIWRHISFSQTHRLNQWRYRMLRRVLRDLMRQHDAAQRAACGARSRRRMGKLQRAGRPDSHHAPDMPAPRA